MLERRSSPRVRPVSAHHRAKFVALVPLIRKQLRFAFRFVPSVVRQEHIDDGLARAFVLFVHLVRRHRVRLAHPTALARYAAYHVRSDRLIGSRRNTRDLLYRAAQRQCGFRLIAADEWSKQGRMLCNDLLADSRQATPAELAAFRVDFAAWLDRLSKRQREIALCLAAGESTMAAACRFQVSSSRISQIRQELATDWHRFQGGQEVPHEAATRNGDLRHSLDPGDRSLPERRARAQAFA